jgi:hypothetical protein
MPAGVPESRPRVTVSAVGAGGDDPHGRRSLRELVYREKHAWVQVLVDENDAVVRFSITVTDLKFKFSARELTCGALPVRLGSSRFSDVSAALSPDGRSLRIGAHNHEYAESYWFGNPGNYQRYVLSSNEIGAGEFGYSILREGPSFTVQGHWPLTTHCPPVSRRLTPKLPMHPDSGPRRRSTPLQSWALTGSPQSWRNPEALTPTLSGCSSRVDVNVGRFAVACAGWSKNRVGISSTAHLEDSRQRRTRYGRGGKGPLPAPTGLLQAANEYWMAVERVSIRSGHCAILPSVHHSLASRPRRIAGTQAPGCAAV